MVLVVKCLICNKELNYTQTVSGDLIHHVRTEHPLVARKSAGSPRSSNDRGSNDWRGSFELNSRNLKTVIDKEVQTTKMDCECDCEPAKLKLQSPQQNSRRSSMSQDTVVMNPASRPPKTIAAQFKLDQLGAINETTPLKSKAPAIASTSKQHKVMNTEIKKNLPQSSKDDPRKRAKLYKTSVEKWRPVGNEKVFCPRCESYKRPIVRTHTERVTESSIVSSFFMACWPICFSPCLFPEPTHENIHCNVCNYHLGIYDHKRKVTIPNLRNLNAQ